MSNVPARSELDDVTLASAKRGNAAASKALVERYQKPVFALLGRLLYRHSYAEIEELAQETFLRVFRALPRFETTGTARLSSWILTIATRLALDYLSRKQTVTESLDETHETVAHPTSSADGDAKRRALGESIARALATLQPDFRAVFLLREYHGLEYDEIASALNIEIGTVRSRLSRARTILQQALEEELHG